MARTEDMKKCVTEVLAWISRVEYKCNQLNDDVWRFLSGEFGSALVGGNISIDDKEVSSLKEVLGILLDKANEKLDSQENLGRFPDLIDKLANREICLQAAYDACFAENLNEVKRALHDFLNC